MTIQEAIRNHRYDAKLSQSELATRSGVSKRNIVFWESGRGNPPLNDCIRIARGLGITIKTLLVGVGLPGEESDEEALH